MTAFLGRVSMVAVLPLIGLCWAVGVNPLFLDRPWVALFLWVFFSGIVALLLQPLHKKMPALKKPARWLLLELGIYLFLCFRPSPPPVQTKLLIVGIDGAHWSLVERFSMSGLQELKAKSLFGPLHADEPLFSPLLWTTIATGKTPAEHGIRGFRTQSTDAKVARFWEIANANGLSVGLYKWLVTWPPTPLESGGFIVPAWLSPSPETWPEDLSVVKELELSRRLRRRNIKAHRSNLELGLAGIPLGFRLSTLIDAVQLSVQQRWLRPSAEHIAWAQQLLRIQIDRDVFVQQLHVHRPDVASITLYATDALGHTHWKWLDCEVDCPPYAGAVSDAYVQADSVLQELQQHVDQNTPILVISDHGFRAATLEDAGRRFQPTTETLRQKLLPMFPSIDVAKLGQKMIVSLPVDASPAELDRLAGAVDSVVISETGLPLYKSESLPDAPSSIGLTLRLERVSVEDLSELHVEGLTLGEFVSLQEPYSGDHDAQGIFSLYMPGHESQQVSMHQTDVLPTLLSLLNIPLAEDLVGKSIIHNPHPPVPSYDALRIRQNASETSDVNSDFLKQLGYIE